MLNEYKNNKDNTSQFEVFFQYFDFDNLTRVGNSANTSVNDDMNDNNSCINFSSSKQKKTQSDLLNSEQVHHFKKTDK